MGAEVLDTVAADAGPISSLRSVEVVVVDKPQRLYRVSRGRQDDRFAEAFQPREQQLRSTLRHAAMTYSIFDSTGNLVDAFDDRAAALDCLARIVGAERQSAGEVYLIVQEDDGNTSVGETV